MAKSSINFQRSLAGSFEHNDRSGDDPNYLIGIDDGQKNEFSCSAIEANKILKKYRLEAKANYKKTVGQKMQIKKGNDHWEAVVNLNRNHTLEDVQRVANFIENDTGFRAIQISVHKDEGRIAEDGKTRIYNNHAHINFFTLNEKTGKQINHINDQLDKNKNVVSHGINRKRLSFFQDETAKILGMERGKEGSNNKRLSAKQYREVAQERDGLKLEIEQLKKQLSNNNPGNEVDIDKKSLKAQISSLNKSLKNDYDHNRETLKNSGLAKQSDYKELKTEFQKALEALKTLQPVEIENRKTKTKKEINSDYMALWLFKQAIEKPNQEQNIDHFINYQGEEFNAFLMDDKSVIITDKMQWGAEDGAEKNIVTIEKNNEIDVAELKKILDEHLTEKAREIERKRKEAEQPRPAPKMKM